MAPHALGSTGDVRMHGSWKVTDSGWRIKYWEWFHKISNPQRGSSWPRKLKRESKGRTGVEVGDSAWKTRLQKQSVHQQEGNWRHVLVVGNLTRFVRNSMEKRSEGIRRGIDWKVNRWKILTWIFCGLTYLSLLLFFMIHFCRYSDLSTSTALPPYTFSQPHTILPYIITVI